METVAENEFVEIVTDYVTYKVICKDKSFRGKSFKGETAWYRARNYANDMLSKAGHPYHVRVY